MVPRKSTLGGFDYIWQSTWEGIIARKTKRAQIDFLSDVLIAVASLDLKAHGCVVEKLFFQSKGRMHPWIKLFTWQKNQVFDWKNASYWGHEAKLARCTYTVPRNINMRYICNIPCTNLQDNLWTPRERHKCIFQEILSLVLRGYFPSNSLLSILFFPFHQFSSNLYSPLGF